MKKLLMRSKIFRTIKDYLRMQEETRNEILKGLVFNSTIVDSKWLKYKSFSPGAWAADFGLLYTLYRVLNDVKPNNVLEFGLGQSSKMIHQYGDYFKKKVLTCEHDEEWIRFFEEGKEGDYYVNIKQLELENIIVNGIETLTYKNLMQEFGDEKYDLIIVDGPYGSDHYSRPQIIELAKLCLCDTFCIIMDDTERVGERETIQEVMKVLDDKGIRYCTRVYYSSKKHTLICSDNLKFLTSL